MIAGIKNIKLNIQMQYRLKVWINVFFKSEVLQNSMAFESSFIRSETKTGNSKLFKQEMEIVCLSNSYVFPVVIRMAIKHS
jgi:hypothetical protein